MQNKEPIFKFVIQHCLLLFLLFYSSQLFADTQPTEVKIFTPFTSKGLDPKLKIVTQVKGYCWVQSLRTQQANAWRCMSGNIIFDPCFVDTAMNSQSAICVDEPWVAEVTKMHFTKPLPKIKFPPFNTKQAQPWFVELSNGDYCQFLTGATSMVAGKRLNYGCNHEQNVYIIGDIDKSSPVWLADYYINKTKTTEKMPVTTVWY